MELLTHRSWSLLRLLKSMTVASSDHVQPWLTPFAVLLWVSCNKLPFFSRIFLQCIRSHFLGLPSVWRVLARGWSGQLICSLLETLAHKTTSLLSPNNQLHITGARILKQCCGITRASGTQHRSCLPKISFGVCLLAISTAHTYECLLMVLLHLKVAFCSRESCRRNSVHSSMLMFCSLRSTDELSIVTPRYQ